MNTEMNNAKKEGFSLLSKFTFADFSHLVNAGMSTSGKLILPNYNKDTASDNLNRFIEISNQGSKYVDAGLLSTTPSSTDINTFSGQSHAFVMKGPEPITGKKNGFLNIAPALGKAAKGFVLTDPPSGSIHTPFPFYPEPLPIYLVTPSPCMNWNCGGVTPFPVPDLPIPGLPIPNPIFGPYPCAYCGAPDFPYPLPTTAPDSTFEYMTGTTFRTFEPFIPSGDYTTISVHPFLQLPVEPPVANGFSNIPFNSGSVVGDFMPNSPDLTIGIGFSPGIGGNQPHVSQ
jgi:hypothetical protein